MKKSTHLVLTVLFLVSCQTSSLHQEQSSSVAPEKTFIRAPADFGLEQVHDALFEMFFPMEKVASNPELNALAVKARDDIWLQISQSKEVLWGFRILDLLTLFRGGFQNLSVSQREKLFHDLETNPVNKVRQQARLLRLYYLRSIYASELSAKLTNVPRLSIVRPDIDDYLAHNPLSLPPSPVTYKKEMGLIESTQGDFDFIVIGSGPAGSVIAHELSRKGKKVILVDQGSFVLPEAADTRRISNLHESMGLRTSTNGQVIFRNGNAIGGGTAINVDLAFSPLLPFIQARIESWKSKGLIPKNQWNYGEMQTAYTWVKENVGTRTLVKEEINRNNKILYDGARAVGRTPSLYDLNNYPEGESPSPSINKKSDVGAFIIPAMKNAQNPLAVVPGAKVTKILWSGESDADGNRVAVGVEIEMVPQWAQKGSVPDPDHLNIPVGTKVQIHAKHVIVSAGTLGTPSLLLRSGLKNKNIGLAPVAHPSMPLIGLFDQPIRVWEGTPSSIYVADHALTDGTILESMTADVSYAAMMLPGDRNQIFDLVRKMDFMGGFGVMVIDTPNKNNRIRIDGKGQPKIDYALSSADAKRFTKAVYEAAVMMFKAGAQKVYLPTNELKIKEFASIDQLEEIKTDLKFVPNRTTITSAHLQASCKMGSTPETSVVAADHHVWGTSNVYVVDSSVFPTSIGANPMQTIYTIAKIFVDQW